MTMAETNTYKKKNTKTHIHRQRQIQSAFKKQCMLYLSKAGGSRISPLSTFCISVVGLPSIFLKNLPKAASDVHYQRIALIEHENLNLPKSPLQRRPQLQFQNLCQLIEIGCRRKWDFLTYKSLPLCINNQPVRVEFFSHTIKTINDKNTSPLTKTIGAGQQVLISLRCRQYEDKFYLEPLSEIGDPPHRGSIGYLATTAWMSSISGWSSAESWIKLRMWARPFTFGLSDAKWTSSSEGHQNCTYVKLHVPIPNERLEWAGDTQVERGSDVKVGIMLLADLRCVPELPLYCTMSRGHPTQWILKHCRTVKLQTVDWRAKFGGKLELPCSARASQHCSAFNLHSSMSRLIIITIITIIVIIIYKRWFSPRIAKIMRQ